MVQVREVKLVQMGGGTKATGAQVVVLFKEGMEVSVMGLAASHPKDRAAYAAVGQVEAVCVHQ